MIFNIIHYFSCCDGLATVVRFSIYTVKLLLPSRIHLLKVNNRNTRTSCEICSKLTIKIPERCQWRYSGISIVNSEHISHLVLMFLLLTLNMQLLAGYYIITLIIISRDPLLIYFRASR